MVGIASVILNIVVSETKKEYSLFIKISGVAIICYIALKAGSDRIAEFLGRLEGLSDTYGLISTLLKGAVICITTQLAHDLCKDSGSEALANAVDIGGRMMIIILSLPLIESVLETALAFMN